MDLTWFKFIFKCTYVKTWDIFSATHVQYFFLGAGLEHLVKLPLDELRIVDCNCDNSALEIISNMTSLRKLSIQGNNVSDTGLAYLSALARLHTLNVSYCENITLSGVKKLIDLPLESLFLVPDLDYNVRKLFPDYEIESIHEISSIFPKLKVVMPMDSIPQYAYVRNSITTPFQKYEIMNQERDSELYHLPNYSNIKYKSGSSFLEN